MRIASTRRSLRRVLACAGVNGDEKALEKMFSLVQERRPDGILFAGGVVRPGTDEKKYVELLDKFFETMGRTGSLAFIIPGPNDAPLSRFLRASKNAELAFTNVFVVHATPVVKGELAICGLGGQLTEREDSEGPIIKYSHSSAEYFLRTLWQADQPIKVLLLSQPPTGRLSGEDGSFLVTEFLNNYHPAICVVSGTKEHRGGDRTDPHVMLVNPGQLSEGSAAWLDRVTRQITILDL
ncbi:MAG: hypothetical protein HYX87_05500 [Chloroflexi bacterium]|nr:hypothetical protein [Chloroflexota bacterium]